MATIDDYGRGPDPLSDPSLSDWAEAVATELHRLAAQIPPGLAAELNRLAAEVDRLAWELGRQMPPGQALRSGQAVLAGASPTTYQVPGLVHVDALHAVNADPTAATGQVTAVVGLGGNPITLHHTFGGGAFRIAWMAVGRP